MKTIQPLIKLSLVGIIIFLSTACDLLNPIFNPQKEFIFPLAVGNKWVYDYSFSVGVESRKGTETWEVTKKTMVSEGTSYSIHYFGQGIAYSPLVIGNNTRLDTLVEKPYSYTGDTIFIITQKYYLIPNLLLYRVPVDTISRFVSTPIDTLKYGNLGGLSGGLRAYVNNVGLLYSYDGGGSPGSGRYSTSLKLRSYTLKP